MSFSLSLLNSPETVYLPMGMLFWGSHRPWKTRMLLDVLLSSISCADAPESSVVHHVSLGPFYVRVRAR